MGSHVSKSLDSFNCRRTLNVGSAEYIYYNLIEAEKNGLTGISQLPFSMKVLLENLLRNEDGRSVTKEAIQAVAGWLTDKGKAGVEIAYRPARVLMQDFTGVPAVVDLAAMRDAMASLGGDPQKINPLVPVDLVIDHSVIVDEFGTPVAFARNVELEYERNQERYNFLKWGQQAFRNFRVVPPGTGICHQVNLEYLAQTVWTMTGEDGDVIAYPDTCVGTDSHTTMVNGLGVLGWGVGGIEAEAAMLGQPVSMLLPEVIGFRLTGKLKEGVTATDLVLTVTQMLRKKGVVGKFVEFFGPGLSNMTLADRATIGNMAPEYGATCGFFPVDSETIRYLTMSGRAENRIALVEAYSKAQGMWRDKDSVDPVFTDLLDLDLSTVVPSMAGPKRPEGRVALEDIAEGFAKAMETEYKKTADVHARYAVPGAGYDIGHGDVVIAAITSCTNTSNPSVLMGAGLLARNANRRGLKQKPWVKTSLAPGSQVVAEYLEKSGLQKELDQIGFNLVGFGCTTCIGNSGPLPGTDLQDHQRQGADRRRSPLRQPQLRRPRIARRAGELPGVAAAGRRLCARRHGQDRPHHRAARRGPRRQAGVPEGHLAVDAGDRRVHHRERHARAVRPQIRRRLQRRRELEGRPGAGRPDLHLGRQFDLCAEPALFRRHGPQAGRQSAASRVRACSACSATRSPPTTSRRPARSRRPRRPANTSPTTASASPTSTSTARAAATMR